MRKALCVGIDSYEHIADLCGCVNDANSVKAALERNGDGTLNFDVKIMVSTSESSYIKKRDLKSSIQELFQGESEIAVFYYSGHGAFDDLGGYLCTSEIEHADEGLSLNDIMGLIAGSQAKNKIIILDSCNSGALSSSREMQDFSVLRNGTTILAACEENQYAVENDGKGVFTSLFVEALYGGAMNLLGEVSPGSIYSYIDRSLGAWEQRPVFKANIRQFVSLRKNSPPISISKLCKLVEIFESPSEEYKLDPTYEPDKQGLDNREVNKEHEEIFSILQHYVKLNLVIPVDEEHMYFAAIHSKSCKLTVQGQHYWNLVHQKRI